MVLRWPPLLLSVGETESGHFRIFEIRYITGQSCIYSGCVIGSSRLRPRGLWRYRRRDRLGCAFGPSRWINPPARYLLVQRARIVSVVLACSMSAEASWRAYVAAVSSAIMPANVASIAYFAASSPSHVNASYVHVFRHRVQDFV